MVTFTLTPTNAESIPRNVVHLIVTEGVTEIPEWLCFGDGIAFQSLETIVFSKSVAVIGSLAFFDCINLKSVMFPNDSQLREIGMRAFQGWKSLRRIDIPDSVTTIGQYAFHQCTNLESVLLTDQSCLQEIGMYAFCHCTSLQSIIIPKSVTAIGEGAFYECSKLKSVIFAEHSSIQTIKEFTFKKCASLQFINIPTTVTTINRYAFSWCHVLHVIDIPHQAIVHPDAFYNCPLLRTILEEHSTDCIKCRFDALPIHQTCYKLNDTTVRNAIINCFHSLQDNDPALLQVDVMSMTPLHILCTNPAVTKDMIKQLYSKNTAAAAVQNANDMLPWHMYVVNKDERFHMFKHLDAFGRIISTIMTDTARMILSNNFDADKLVEANLHIDVMEMYLILTGSSLGAWLETSNVVTGLYPFMSMAKSSTYNLEDVYEFAMMNLNSISSDREENAATDERTKDAKRVKLA